MDNNILNSCSNIFSNDIFSPFSFYVLAYHKFFIVLIVRRSQFSVSEISDCSVPLFLNTGSQISDSLPEEISKILHSSSLIYCKTCLIFSSSFSDDIVINNITVKVLLNTIKNKIKKN